MCKRNHCCCCPCPIISCTPICYEYQPWNYKVVVEEQNSRYLIKLYRCAVLRATTEVKKSQIRNSMNKLNELIYEKMEKMLDNARLSDIYVPYKMNWSWD